VEPGFIFAAAGVSELRSHLDSPDPGLGGPAADPCGHVSCSLFFAACLIYLYFFVPRQKPEART